MVLLYQRWLENKAVDRQQQSMQTPYFLVWNAYLCFMLRHRNAFNGVIAANGNISKDSDNGDAILSIISESIYKSLVLLSMLFFICCNYSFIGQFSSINFTRGRYGRHVA